MRKMRNYENAKDAKNDKEGRFLPVFFNLKFVLFFAKVEAWRKKRKKYL